MIRRPVSAPGHRSGGATVRRESAGSAPSVTFPASHEGSPASVRFTFAECNDEHGGQPCPRESSSARSNPRSPRGPAPTKSSWPNSATNRSCNRSWSGFSNFAISFSIISILAGCFTTFASGWNGGGPAAIAWGWPILAALILCIGLCLAELVSAYPTSGGIYWWASKLGGAKAGLLHRLAQPDRPAGHRGLGGLRVRHLPRPHPGLLHHQLALRAASTPSSCSSWPSW